jgi:hypothetical protein
MEANVGQSLSLKQRLSKVMLEVSSNLADSAGGALVQVNYLRRCCSRLGARTSHKESFLVRSGCQSIVQMAR